MLNFEKIDRIATKMEQLLEEDSLAEKIDERTEKEKKEQEKADALPQPALEASEDDVKCSECDKQKKAGLKKMIHLAKMVKASKKMTASEKKTALSKIAAKAKETYGQDNDDEQMTIDRKLLSQQNHGKLEQKIREIFNSLGNLKAKGIKPSTPLSKLGVNIPMQANNWTFRWLVNVLYDIIVK